MRDIVGHRRFKRLLMRAVHSGSLPQSLVFAGPEGVGKRQTALALAQALNCLNPAVDEEGLQDACGTCASCGKVGRGLHPDVMVIRREDDKKSIPVSEAREINRHVAYRPFEGLFRVVIVDGADELGADTQDALLKTLEEPPPRNVFILVTSRPDMLFTTVLSRCCVLRFAPLAPADVAAALAGRHGLSERDALAAAALSGGSLGRALQLGDAADADLRGLAVRLLSAAVQTTDERARLEAGAGLLTPAAKKPSTVEKGGKSQADRAALAASLRAMESLLRDVAVLTTRAPDAALVNLDLRAELEPLARRYDRDRAGRAFSAVGRSLVALERHNASPKIVVDWLALQL